ncbi:MAG: twin-arginine translocase subunit TatC, partial [Agromyces sp.]
PVWLWQVFAYFVPALTRKERRYVFGFFFSAIPLFFAGCWSGWVLLPHMVALMTSFVPNSGASYLDAGYYFQFVIKLMIAVGIAFVVPVVLVMLNFLGMVSAAAIIKNWRVALMVILLFTAIATPAADVVSMFLLAIPMIALYFAAWAIAVIHDRRLAKRQSQLDEEYGLS